MSHSASQCIIICCIRMYSVVQFQKNKVDCKTKIQIRDANTFNFGLCIPWECYNWEIFVYKGRGGVFMVLINLDFKIVFMSANYKMHLTPLIYISLSFFWCPQQWRQSLTNSPSNMLTSYAKQSEGQTQHMVKSSFPQMLCSNIYPIFVYLKKKNLKIDFCERILDFFQIFLKETEETDNFPSDSLVPYSITH